MLLLSPAFATLIVQWDNRWWGMAIIWALGSVIIWNLKRFHICATYVASFFFFAVWRALLPDSPLAPDIALIDQIKTEIAPITGPMYQLFIFFMITDPKTTVKSKKAQIVVAFLVAAMEHILRVNRKHPRALLCAVYHRPPRIAGRNVVEWTSQRQAASNRYPANFQ